MNGQQQRTLAFFASHPLISFIASVASIVSVPLAFFFYFGSTRTRDLKVFVNPATTSIVKSGESSELRVLFHDQPVTTDVTGLQVAVWNSGKEPIHAEDVLDPVYITASVPILEARIRRLSRQTTRFAIDPQEEAHGRLGLSWRILEHNDGAVIQLIVAGGQPTIDIEGTVEGQHRLSTITLRKQRWYDAIPVLFLMLPGMFLVAILQVIKRSPPPRWRFTFRQWIILVGVASLTGFMIYFVVSSRLAEIAPSVPLPLS